MKNNNAREVIDLFFLLVQRISTTQHTSNENDLKFETRLIMSYLPTQALLMKKAYEEEKNPNGLYTLFTYEFN